MIKSIITAFYQVFFYARMGGVPSAFPKTVSIWINVSWGKLDIYTYNYMKPLVSVQFADFTFSRKE